MKLALLILHPLISNFNGKANSTVSMAGYNFYRNIFRIKIIMSCRQFVFLLINKIHNYANILFITFCQYKMSLFKFIGLGLLFVRLRGGSVKIPFFSPWNLLNWKCCKVILLTVTLLSLMYISQIIFEKTFSKDQI